MLEVICLDILSTIFLTNVSFLYEEVDLRFTMTFWRGNARGLREIIAVVFFVLCWVHRKE